MQKIIKETTKKKLVITSYDPKPMLAQCAKQFNIFEREGDYEKGELVLIHEPHHPTCVAMGK